MFRRALVVVILSACYRDQAAPPPVNAGRDPIIAISSLKCGPDDRAHPPTDTERGKRLRSHTSGSLAHSNGAAWSWAGRDVPDHVPRHSGKLELFILDEVDDGLLAFYRAPYGRGSCGLGDSTNCAYEARLYDRRGRQRWSVPLDALLSRPDQLEIQDIRYVGGVLYFNEACQGYSAGANGKCSALVAIDPKTAEVLWRTHELVSNSRFVVRGCYLVAGYGFTSERDHLFLVDRGTGRIVQKLPISSAPEGYELADDELAVELASGTQRRFRLVGMDTPEGRIEPLDPPEAIYGGAGYGGLGYGGAAP